MILTLAGLTLLTVPGLTIESYGQPYINLEVKPLVSNVQHVQAVKSHGLPYTLTVAKPAPTAALQVVAVHNLLFVK